MMVPQTQVLSTKVSQAEALSGLNVDALEIFDMLGSFVVQPDVPGKVCTGPKMARIWTE